MGRELTGRKVLIFTVSAFAVVVGVNLTLAYQAVHTFPGLEVANSYVASQEFNANLHEQQALGWTTSLDYDEAERVLALRFEGADGQPVEVRDLDVLVGRATSVRDDKRPAMLYYNGTFSSPLDLGPGFWTIRVTAAAEDGTPFRQRLQLHVDG
ncbi:FixH family protein [Rhodovulum visakhapatnamense]|uniref:YD repeat-containing protein n=1 Tax=Rhodovulum visakhapatnamense TaxID=364297 RepID=A0A4R8FE42_9RHOB|nr:FixH family protein [Rhodovulum visakhapatnamense]TDX24130.1 YD repeat-containing protein [Rhodovulum visakhapatnamense]